MCLYVNGLLSSLFQYSCEISCPCANPCTSKCNIYVVEKMCFSILTKMFEYPALVEIKFCVWKWTTHWLWRRHKMTTVFVIIMWKKWSKDYVHERQWGVNWPVINDKHFVTLLWVATNKCITNQICNNGGDVVFYIKLKCTYIYEGDLKSFRPNKDTRLFSEIFLIFQLVSL